MKNQLLTILIFFLGCYYKLITFLYRNVFGHFITIKKFNTQGYRETFMYYANSQLLDIDTYIVTVYCEFTFQFIMHDDPRKLKYFETNDIIKCITEIPKKRNIGGLDTVKFESAYLMKKNTNLGILDSIALYHTPNTDLTIVDLENFTITTAMSDTLTFSDIFIA